MSAKEFSQHGKGFELKKQPAQSSGVSLNEVFRESMKRARSVYPVDIVTRCEAFPPIANGKDLRELFDVLLNLIFKMAKSSTKLYLYVDCEEEIVTAMPQNKKNSNYLIRFHTSVSAGSDWEKANAGSLSRCNEIVSNYGGSFMVNTISNSGCLFFITLPANQK